MLRNKDLLTQWTFGIRIDLYGKRTPHIVMVLHDQRTAEWLVEQILSRCESAQSGTVPDDLTRLTKQAGETEASTRPANASATTQTT